MAIIKRPQPCSADDSRPPSRICPKCFKKLDTIPFESPCPLCKETDSYGEDRYRKETPVIMTLSEEFAQQNRLLPSSKLSRKSRGCPCCLQNRKPCDKCIHSEKYRKMQSTSSSTISQTSDYCRGLELSRPRSRFSMYSMDSSQKFNNCRRPSTENLQKMKHCLRRSQVERSSDECHDSRPRTASRSGRRGDLEDRKNLRDRNQGVVRDRPSTAGRQVGSGKSRRKTDSAFEDEVARYTRKGKGFGPESKSRKKSSVTGKKIQESVCNQREMTCEEKLAELQAKLKARRRTRPRPLKALNVRSRYSYCFGRKYPGIKVGHRECILNRGLVPCNMGWLWNVPTLGINQVEILLFLHASRFTFNF